MTGNELFDRVCLLLGYYDLLKSGEPKLKLSFLNALNSAAADLKLSEVDSLNTSLELSQAYLDALLYATAMFFSLSLKDTVAARLYSELYSVKRSFALSQKERRENVLPFPSQEGN